MHPAITWAADYCRRQSAHYRVAPLATISRETAAVLAGRMMAAAIALEVGDHASVDGRYGLKVAAARADQLADDVLAYARMPECGLSMPEGETAQSYAATMRERAQYLRSLLPSPRVPRGDYTATTHA